MPAEYVNESVVIDSKLEQALQRAIVLAQTKSGVSGLARARPFRPSDVTKFSSVVGTPGYSWTINAGPGTTTLLTFTVPTAYALVLFGFQTSGFGSLVPGGYVSVSVNNVEKQHVSAIELARDSMIYLFDQVLEVIQQQQLSIAVYNPTTVSQTVGLWFLGYIASTPSNLNISE
ncbi:MAG: hypothetical protein ACP5LW_05805 [Nitrososphaeria archaeon]